MATTYLPRTDSGLNAWANNFSNQINSLIAPPDVGLTLEDATGYATLQADFAAKLMTAVDPGTRGPAATLAKNLSKKALIAESRKLAMAATNHPATTDEQRQALGLTVRDNEPTPVPVPSDPPQMDVVSVHGRRVALRLRDSVTGERKKPEGVQGATLVSYVGPTIPSSVRDWTFEANTTRTDVELEFDDSIAMGTKVWVAAFWFNRRGESGPACSPVSTHLGFGALAETDLSSGSEAA